MEVHQLLTCLSYGDAISNNALQIRQIPQVAEADLKSVRQMLPYS